MLHLGEYGTALDLATKAKALTTGEPSNYSYSARLAYGMAQTMADPELGKRYLENIAKDENYMPQARLLTQRALYLAWAHLQTADP